MEHNGTCPNCGYCPHCGRKNAQPPYPIQQPWYPWTAPYTPTAPPMWPNTQPTIICTTTRPENIM